MILFLCFNFVYYVKLSVSPSIYSFRLHLWYLRMLPKDNIILQNMFCFLFLSQLMWLFCFCYCFWFGLFCFVLFCVVIQREFDKVFLVYLISDSYINYLSNIFTMSMLRTWWMIACLIDFWCFMPLSAIFQLHVYHGKLYHLWLGVECTLFSSPDPSQVSYCHHLASVVCRKRFQKSSPLKVLNQWKPKLVWIITRVSSFKKVSGDAVHQPTWLLLLKIEHMVKLQVLGNNSKTVNNIKIWQGKNVQRVKIYPPCNFEVNPITHFGVISLFSSKF